MDRTEFNKVSEFDIGFIAKAKAVVFLPCLFADWLASQQADTKTTERIL